MTPPEPLAAPAAPPWQALVGWLEGLGGKTVVVTGASSGIGRAVATAMGAAGARVALLARRRGLLETVAAEIGRAGSEALVVPTDVTDAQQVRAAFAHVARETGRLDVVVNNAGVLVPGPVADLTAADFMHMLQVNLLGALFVMQEAVRHMRAGDGGSIVNVASLGGRRGVSPLGGYCATKFGLVGLTEALRMELRDEPIHVALVLPGFVDTAMVEGALHRDDVADLLPAWLTMPPAWVAWTVMAAIRFRLLEISVPPGAGTLEKIAALAPGVADLVVQWTTQVGHWLTRLTRR